MMSGTTIYDALLENLVIGISQTCDSAEKGTGDMLVEGAGLVRIEQTGQLLRPASYGLDAPGGALSFVQRMRRRDDDPLLARLETILESGVRLSEAHAWPAAPGDIVVAERDADTQLDDREVSLVLHADATHVDERSRTMLGISDDNGTPFRGLEAARAYTFDRATQMMAANPERDWWDWTWTAHVWTTGQGGADERVDICSVRVNQEAKLDWEREEPSRRFSVRVAGSGDRAVWLDLHTGREVDAPNPFATREAALREKDADRVPAPRELLPEGTKGW